MDLAQSAFEAPGLAPPRPPRRRPLAWYMDSLAGMTLFFAAAVVEEDAASSRLATQRGMPQDLVKIIVTVSQWWLGGSGDFMRGPRPLLSSS